VFAKFFKVVVSIGEERYPAEEEATSDEETSPASDPPDDTGS
jgi:hypothetical protein